MNRLLATVALLGAFTSTSAFAEGGISWAWNNEVTAEYSVDAEKTIMDYEPEMNIVLHKTGVLTLEQRFHYMTVLQQTVL